MIIKCNGIEIFLNEEESMCLINNDRLFNLLKTIHKSDIACDEKKTECEIDIEDIYDCIF